MTAAFLNRKFGEVENKIPDHAKQITTPEFHKFAETIFDEKLKQANLTMNSDFTAVSQCANRKIEKQKQLKNCKH